MLASHSISQSVIQFTSQPASQPVSQSVGRKAVFEAASHVIPCHSKSINLSLKCFAGYVIFVFRVHT